MARDADFSPALPVEWEGGGSSSSPNANCFSVTMNGSFNKYSVKSTHSNFSNRSNYTEFSATEEVSITVKNIWSGALLIDFIYVYYDNQLVKKIQTHDSQGGLMEWLQGDSFTIPLNKNCGEVYGNGTSDFYARGLFGMYRGRSTIIDAYTNPYSTYSQKNVSVKIVVGDVAYGEYTIGNVAFLPLVMRSNLTLTTTNAKKTYYKNETLNTAGLLVYSSYKYHTDVTGGSEVIAISSVQESNFSTSPANGTLLTASQNVTVTCGSATGQYAITVYGVTNFTKPTIKSPRNNAIFRVGETYTIGQATIYYGGIASGYNSSNETVDVTVTGGSFNAGKQQLVSYSIVATRTGETLTWESYVDTYDLYKIVLNTTNVTKEFNFNETFSTTNLSLTEYYGDSSDDDAAGTESVSSLTNYDIDELPLIAGVHEINVSHKTKSVSSSYEVCRNGIIAATITLEETKFEVGSAYPTGVSNFNEILVKRIDNFVTDEDYDEFDFNVTNTELPATIDMNAVGEQSLTFKLKENGQEYEANASITIYEYDALVFSNVNATEKVYVASLSSEAKLNDTFIPNLNNLIVKITSSSGGDDVTLTKGAVSSGYHFNPAWGSNLTVGQENVIEIISTDYESLKGTFVVDVQVNTIKEDGGIRITPNAASPYVEIGEDIDITKYVDKVEAEFEDGNYYVVSYTTKLREHDNSTTLKLTNADTIGETYHLDIYVGETLAGTIEIILNGVKTISNITNSQTIYDIGEFFHIYEENKNYITYDVEYEDGSKEYSQTIGITTSRSTAFTKAEANANSGVVSVSLTIRGQSKSVDITVRKVSSLTYTSLSNTNYLIHGDLDVASLAFKKQYNDGSDPIALTDNEVGSIEWSFTDSSDNDIDDCLVNDLIPESTRTSATVKVTATYTEGGVEVSATTFSISVKAVQWLKLYETIEGTTTEVSALYVNQGDSIFTVLNGCAYKFKYNDGTYSVQTNIIAKTDYAIDPSELNDAVTGTSAITAHITITDSATSEQVDTSDFTVHIHYIDDIDTNLSSIVDSVYYVGDTLDLSTLTVAAEMVSTDENETLADVTITDFVITLNSNVLSSNTYRFVEANANASISVSYGLFSKSKSFVVNAVVLSSISVVLGSSFKSLTDYYDDQYLNLDGLTVTRTYNNGYVETGLPYYDTNVKLLDGNGDAFSKTQKLSNSSHNGTVLYISYTENGVTKTVVLPSNSGTLVVTAKALTSIEVVQNPTKTTYTYGDTFSVNGLVVKANFNNGISENITLTDLTISGDGVNQDSTMHTFNPTDDTTFEAKTITLSYTYGGVTKTTSFAITLVKPQIAYLTTNANTDVVRKQFKDGDTYSNSGLVVTAVMTNGWSVVLATFLTDAATVLNLANSVINVTGNYGQKTITISGTNPYDSNDTKTTTYTIDVETSGAITSAVLMLDQEVDYKNYFVGDKYTAKGVSWFVTDIDGKTFVSGVFTTSIQLGSVLRSAQRMTVSVTYTNGSFTKSETYDIIVSIANLVSFTDTNNYKIAVGYLSGGSSALFESITHEEAEIFLGKKYEDGKLVGEYYPVFHEDLISVDDNPLHTDTYGYNVYTGVDAEHDCIGYMDFGLTAEDGTVIRQAHFIPWVDPINPIDGQGNIEVKIPHYVEGYANRINNCHFGIVYNNRLFVSGNPEFKNCDWHSGEVNVSQIDDYNNKAIKDFTYFSDLDYCYYGDSDTAVVGYDIYRDGDLIVVKEGSKHQATLYRRTMKLTAATSADGTSIGQDLAEQSFPMYDINSNGGVGGLSNRSIVNFIGETIVLTKNGVKAITNKDDVYNTAKYSFDVSTFINDRITEENLKNAILYVFNETLLLKTIRGVYVGYHGLRNDDNEYEWYFLNNINADIFFEFDDELYFANNKGEIYRFPFNKKDYQDKPRTFVGVGGTAPLQFDVINDKLVASVTYKDEIVEGRPFHLLTKYTLGGADKNTQIFANLGSFVNKNYKNNVIINGGAFDQTAYVGLMDADNNTLEIKIFNSNGTENKDALYDKQNLFYDGREVYIDQIVGGVYHLSIYERYFLKKYNDSIGNVYQLVDRNGEVLDLIGINTMRMSFLVNDLAITYITEVSNYGSSGAKQFSLLGDHDKKLDLIYYAIEADDEDTNRAYSGVITKEENINAYYVTAPYSMGSIALTKTIWQWIIANDTALASYMDVGYLSSRKQGDYEMVVNSTQGTRAYDINGINFDKIQFASDKLPHVYSKSRTVPSVNFIRFVFKNEQASNMVLTTLSVIYSIAEFTKGVK